MEQIPEIGPGALPRDVTLLDVREDDEWAAGHADKAVHVPMDEVPDRVGELPTNSDIVVVCRTGGRSAHVTAWLRAQGYRAVNLAGGMVAFAAAGLPLTAEAGRNPTIL